MLFMTSRINLKCLSLIALFLMALSTNAQTENELRPLIHVCILPKESITTPYLVTFRDTDLETNTLGFSLPISADVVIYGNETTNVKFGIFLISPDAATGGYRHGLAEKVLSGATRTDIQRNDACAEQYPSIITENTPTTTRQELVPNQAMFLEFVAVDSTESPEDPNVSQNLQQEIIVPETSLGVFSLHFRPIFGSSTQDIQLIQTSLGGIEVSFPGITEDTTRFITIGNKEFGIQISFAEYPDDPTQPINANRRPNFSRLLEAQRSGIESEATLSLFTLMNEANNRFYPYGGVIADYPANGFIRIDTSGESRREPAFISSDGSPVTITPIEGATPNLYGETGGVSQMQFGDESQVVEITPDGALIVSGGRAGGRSTVDAWLVEVRSNNN